MVNGGLNGCHTDKERAYVGFCWVTLAKAENSFFKILFPVVWWIREGERKGSSGHSFQKVNVDRH
jgi:hypothetical protein